MRYTFALGIIAGLLFTSAPAFATSVTYNFSGSASDGTASATMNLSTLNNTLTATLNNTSPITSSGGGNAPGISAFGFNLNLTTANVTSWTLTAFNSSNTLVSIGGGSPWGLFGSTAIGSHTMDFAFTNGPGGSTQASGMLFNPLALGLSQLPGGGNVNYFTTATLTLNFNSAPIIENGSVVKFQNIGSGGGGSLVAPGSVPEPSSLLLLGAGLAGLRLYRRNSMKQ